VYNLAVQSYVDQKRRSASFSLVSQYGSSDQIRIGLVHCGLSIEKAIEPGIVLRESSVIVVFIEEGIERVYN
jgi:hypothetical protein